MTTSRLKAAQHRVSSLVYARKLDSTPSAESKVSSCMLQNEPHRKREEEKEECPIP